ncbi:JAB domain-containing protein [Sphingobacterium oryzagri]|uniref:JAB domain-containing protein n=1 Tax=Sphingobacterium oryzagri TaxID=3025669 RepID=A0ABY7WJ07_9SPHI|nr:JAB domain-containing protein [Sphingobacterium sp. KACC 22765]WDF69591.1 JAB domain-containing protein [Sphingobacterium sp. KACC 22765]
MKNRLIANELRISYHKKQELSIEAFKSITNSSLMDGVFRMIWDIDEMDVRESFYALYFNNKLDLVGYRKIADGGIDAIHVDIRLIMSSALLCNAIRICVAHNHPSGTLRPSQADRQLTRKMIEAGKVLDIQLLDHLILTGESYYSFRDEGDI